MTIVHEPSAHPAVADQAPAVPWHAGLPLPARPAAPGTTAPVMGPADPGTRAPLMGPAAPGTAVAVMGPAGRGTGALLMGPAAPGTAIPAMGPADPVATPLMCAAGS